MVRGCRVRVQHTVNERSASWGKWRKRARSKGVEGVETSEQLDLQWDGESIASVPTHLLITNRYTLVLPSLRRGVKLGMSRVGVSTPSAPPTR